MKELKITYSAPSTNWKTLKASKAVRPRRRLVHNLCLYIVPLSLLSASVVSESACAEGFPGIGNRLLYADALPHYNLGNRYLNKEWYEKAVEKYHDAIKIYPYDADVYTNLGLALRKMNDVAGAEQAYREALKLNDKDWMTWSNLANMLMIQDRFPESLKCFESALKCKVPPEEKDAIEK
ncbi:MAG: tetratricopeptide repeat protein, partial [Cyanobacteria bacterium]|nr:tetratricopeptide repeat protein [Cyanobacteriota bacterium]